MAELTPKTINELPLLQSPSGTALFAVSQDGASYRVPLSAVYAIRGSGNLTGNWLDMSYAYNGTTKFIRCAVGPNAAMGTGIERPCGTLPAEALPSYNITHVCVVNQDGTIGTLKIYKVADADHVVGAVTFTPSDAIPTSKAIYINLAYV